MRLDSYVWRVQERWAQQDVGQWLTFSEARELIERRISEDQLTTWFESDRGRTLAVVTNRERAMVMLLDGPEDAGAHAIDPKASGTSEGYVLENGQSDEYADRDTVELRRALAVVEHIILVGEPPADAAWSVDR